MLQLILLQLDLKQNLDEGTSPDMDQFPSGNCNEKLEIRLNVLHKNNCSFTSICIHLLTADGLALELTGGQSHPHLQTLN